MKTSKIKRMSIMTNMVLAVIVLCAGCGKETTGENSIETVIEAQIEDKEAGETISNPNDFVEEETVQEESQEGQESHVTNESDVAENQTDMYDYILEEYKDMVQNDFYWDLLGTDSFESSFGEDIGFEIRAHKKAVYYAFYDIDGNGVKELIIAGGEEGVGVANPAFSPWNYDLYGYDGTNVVHIFPEMEFGYRTNFTLYGDGVIEVFFSGSAAESGIEFYRIGEDGYIPQLVESFAVVGHLEGEKAVFTYSHNGNEITEEEYNDRVQSYEVPFAEALEWEQIR